MEEKGKLPFEGKGKRGEKNFLRTKG